MENVKYSLLVNCPRCSGRIYLDADEHGRFQHCLQCGYTKDLDGLVAVNTVPDSERDE